MRYSPAQLDEITRRTDLAALVGRRVKLTRKGRVLWGCCPFHSEKSASFKVENERGAYKCFGCGAGGDAFKWLMETEGLTFPEAVQRLADEAGVELPKWSPADEQKAVHKKSLLDLTEAAAAWFEEQLRAPAGARARDYLRGRGLAGDSAKRFRIGYAPASGLIDHMKDHNVGVDDMIDAGLARATDTGPRDFFFDRVVFPITDPSGRVIAFGARALGDAKPKYINSPDTPLFAKGSVLYNFAKARPAGIKALTIIVAEGYMDVIALTLAGFEASVAPLGTALTPEQLGLLWRVAPEPVLCFDGDDAGKAAAHRAARMAVPYLQPGHSLRFAFMPAGADPDSFLRSRDRAAMAGVLAAAAPLVDELWAGCTQGQDFSTPERRAGLERVLADLVADIGDPKVADYYRRAFDQRVFDNFKRRQTRPVASGPTVAKPSRLAARRLKEVELAGLLLADPALAERHAELLADLPIGTPDIALLRHRLLDLAADGAQLERGGLLERLEADGQAGLVDRVTALGGLVGAGEDVDGLLLAVAADIRRLEAEPAPRSALAGSAGTEEAWAEAIRRIGAGDESSGG